MSESKEKLNNMHAIGELLVTELAKIPDIDYLVCAVSHDGDASMIYTSLHCHDRETGEPTRPSVGLMTDLIVAARYSTGHSETNQQKFRDVENLKEERKM